MHEMTDAFGSSIAACKEILGYGLTSHRSGYWTPLPSPKQTRGNLLVSTAFGGPGILPPFNWLSARRRLIVGYTVFLGFILGLPEALVLGAHLRSLPSGAGSLTAACPRKAAARAWLPVLGHPSED